MKKEGRGQRDPLCIRGAARDPNPSDSRRTHQFQIVSLPHEITAARGPSSSMRVPFIRDTPQPSSTICRGREPYHPSSSSPSYACKNPLFRIINKPTSCNYFGIRQFVGGTGYIRERLSRGPMIDRSEDRDRDCSRRIM